VEYALKERILIAVFVQLVSFLSYLQLLAYSLQFFTNHLYVSDVSSVQI